MRAWLAYGAVLLLTNAACASEPVSPSGWDAERRLSSGAADSRLTYNFARSIAVDELGAVHVVWYEEEATTSRVRYARSPDGGATWEASRALSDASRGGQHPSIAVSGSNVYVGWHTREMPPAVFVRRSPDRGATWEEARPLGEGVAGSAHVVLAASGLRVHAVWGEAGEIQTRASADGAVSWSAVTRISELGSFSWVPTVAVEGFRVIIAWVDYRDGNEEEYARRSADGGATWAPAMRLTSDRADSWAPSLALAGGVVHLAWFDRRDAAVQDDELERRLDDLLAEVGIAAAPPPPRDPEVYYLDAFQGRIQEKLGRVQAAAPDFVRRGGDPHRLEDDLRRFERAMTDWATGWEIYYKRSPDGGATWGPDMRLTKAPGESARPSIAARGEDVRIAWHDGRDGNLEIYYRRSRDGGLTWEPEQRLTHAPGASQHASLALGPDGRVHIAWFGERDTRPQIYYVRSR